MANTVISNNGNEYTAEKLDESGNVIAPAAPADPNVKITDTNGNVKIIPPGVSVGLVHGRYIVEVI